MSTPPTVPRQESIERLPALARHLHALQPSLAARQLALRDVASIECLQCGIRLNGEELLGLMAAEVSEPRLARLKKGYCARQGCDTRFVAVHLREVPGHAWPADWEADQTPEELAPAIPVRPRWEKELLRRHGRPLLMGIVVIGGLLLARHWYQGGTIPYLREPEKFVVDVPAEAGGGRR